MSYYEQCDARKNSEARLKLIRSLSKKSFKKHKKREYSDSSSDGESSESDSQTLILRKLSGFNSSDPPKLEYDHLGESPASSDSESDSGLCGPENDCKECIPDIKLKFNEKTTFIQESVQEKEDIKQPCSLVQQELLTPTAPNYKPGNNIFQTKLRKSKSDTYLYVYSAQVIFFTSMIIILAVIIA